MDLLDCTGRGGDLAEYPAYAVQYLSVSEAQRAAFPSATFTEVQPGRVWKTMAQVHRLMSFHDPHNDVSRLNREASTRAVPVHAWTYQHRQSAGVFDVTVAPLLQCGLLPRDAGDLPGGLRRALETWR